MHAPPTADEGKGQFEGGCAEIDGELYSIVALALVFNVLCLCRIVELNERSDIYFAVGGQPTGDPLFVIFVGYVFCDAFLAQQRY